MQSQLAPSNFPAKVEFGKKYEAIKGEIVEGEKYTNAVFTLVDSTQIQTTSDSVKGWITNGTFDRHLESNKGEPLDIYFYQEDAVDPKTNKKTGNKSIHLSLYPRR